MALEGALEGTGDDQVRVCSRVSVGLGLDTCVVKIRVCVN